VAVLTALWCAVAVAQEGKVYKSWPEAEKVVQKTWRPIIAVFVQQGDTQFMGSGSIMGKEKFKKVLKYFVLVQVDLVKKGTDDKLGVADEKNGGLMNKLLGQTSKTLPIFVVAGPDMKPLKVWERADPAVVEKEIVSVIKSAKSKYKPLLDKDVKEAESWLKRAGKLEEEGKEEEAVKMLKKVIRKNKECSLGKQAQEMIDRLKGEKKEEGLTDFDDDEEDGEDGNDEEKKEEKKKPEPTTVIVVMKTDFGKIEIELLTDKAPKTCEHFISLVKSGIYDGSSFGYVERGKLVQCVPDAKKKLPGEVEADFGDLKHEPGVVAMDQGSDSKKIGAAFYIVVSRLKDRDDEYAVFGKVKSGLNVAQTIASVKTRNYKPVNKVTISKIEIKE
jgi:peptidyl-prolyl cis-trans isomerase B (cyclophilin B)